MATTANRFDPQPPDKSSIGPSGARSEQGPNTYMDEAEPPLDDNGRPIDMLALIGRAETLSKAYQLRTIEKPLNRAYRAWGNQHAEGSKYLGGAYRGRSRLFVPKTRSAVRKNLATAAGALFSNENPVNVEAEYQDDPAQMATAAVLKEDLAYRLGRSSARSGMPWYQIALGGCLDSQLTGLTISKQYWQYEEVASTETVSMPLTDPETNAAVVDLHGQPVMVPTEVPSSRVTFDRPMIELMPIENALIDPAAPWYAPEQLGRWFSMRYPMGLSDVKSMLNSPGKNGSDTGWIAVSEELLLKGRLDDDRSAVRRAREGGPDRYQDGRGTNDLDIVWIQENFLRISGVDYTWWSVGRYGYISKVRETHIAYPALDGERPYVLGFAQIDTHRIFPMSPVESWQPLQLELNDITNLRQDTLKRAIAPLAMVKRGANVDLPALQRRGQPEAVVMLNDPAKDVVLQQTPGPSGAAYTETSVNNAMFDELAGVFSTSSVQSNRQLNETVGGMRLMSGAANSVSEFDLRTWVETWVERALRQVVHLVRAFESDEKILQLCGAKANVANKYNYLPTLSDFDATEVSLRVNVGIGALDPMQQLGKLKVAAEMLGPMLPILKAQGITPDGEAWVEEIMGKAGFRDGKRFFKIGDPPDPSQNPDMMKLTNDKAAIDARVQVAQINAASAQKIDAADNLTKLALAKMDSALDVTQMLVDVETGRESRAHAADEADKGRVADSLHAMIGGGDSVGEGGDGGEPPNAGGPKGPKLGTSHSPTSARELVAHALQRKPGTGAGAPAAGGSPPGQDAPHTGLHNRVSGALRGLLGGDASRSAATTPEPSDPSNVAHAAHLAQTSQSLANTSSALAKIMDRLEALALHGASAVSFKEDGTTQDR